MTKDNQQYALISLSDKEGIEDLARALVYAGVGLISTGGTLKAIQALDLPVSSVEDFTHFPEMMGGRVKTLHPTIHGGLLADRSKPDHLEAMADHQIPNINYVIVNLYPFTQVIEADSVDFLEAIENIDIGGPTMLRSAAKNHASVTVVTDKADYQRVIDELKADKATSLTTRRYLARKVYQLTSYYDTQIANYLSQEEAETETEVEVEEPAAWPFMTQAYQLKESLRYGENSHQAAKFYQDLKPAKSTIAGAKQLNGKALSYNNIKDADVALNMLADFTDQAVAIAIKHMNPCGVGLGSDINQAFDRCFEADSVSIFGGIVSFNRPVDQALAERLHELFLEIIIAPAFTDEALSILSQKANLRLLEVDLPELGNQVLEQTSVSGGLVVQEKDHSSELAVQGDQQPEDWTVHGEADFTTEDLSSMSFLMKVVKYVKSNAIVVGSGPMTLGVGAGQMNRVTAAKLALDQMQARDQRPDGKLILASDAFIPMRDTVDLAAEYNVDIIVQPGGSIRDKDVIQACQEHGITLVMTGLRHFKH